jgi:uncharacterized protein with PQ loop repeat
VFTPQIIQNAQRASAEGLSITFLLIWLLGDVFNIVGAVAQGVLPTMILLAAYYTLADVVLLGQCFWYHRRRKGGGGGGGGREERRESVDAEHLSPATPLLGGVEVEPTPAWIAVVVNAAAVLLVCAAGTLGWLVTCHYTTTSGSTAPTAPTTTPPPPPPPPHEKLVFSPVGQVFGYLCAALYLSSRIPQILLNARRKSCEGVSILFFIFACMGNVTYVLSILANEVEEGMYARYLAVNASWLLGSVGTLVLDAVIFAQFFVYGDGGEGEKEESEEGV